MVGIKIALFAFLLVGVSCRSINEFRTPYGYIEDTANILTDDIEDELSEVPVFIPISRVRRQLHGSMNTNPDGTANLNAKLPLAGNDQNRLSAIGGLTGIKDGGGFGSGSGGLALENVSINEFRTPYGYIEDTANILTDDIEDELSEVPVFIPISRVRRQLHGSMNTNPDGTANLNAKLPLAGNDQNRLSAIGGLTGIKDGGGFGSGSGGLALENVNGHALSVTGRHIPNFADQLSAAGNVNLLKTDNHNLNANAFATKTMPINPNVPNFNTYGGGADYMFKDKIGASLGMAHTDLFKKTDYSAMGNLNLFKNRDSSLDLNAGFTKSVSPFIPNSSWQRSGGLTFTRFW